MEAKTILNELSINLRVVENEDNCGLIKILFIYHNYVVINNIILHQCARKARESENGARRNSRFYFILIKKYSEKSIIDTAD